MLNFDAFIQNENEVTVLFYAEWFSPSLVLKEKLVSELAKEQLLLIDVDDAIELTHRFKIKEVPTLLNFSKGEITFRSL
jgi:thioredoxin-like negative regulator of GroEL